MYKTSNFAKLRELNIKNSMTRFKLKNKSMVIELRNNCQLYWTTDVLKVKKKEMEIVLNIWIKQTFRGFNQNIRRNLKFCSRIWDHIQRIEYITIIILLCMNLAEYSYVYINKYVIYLLVALMRLKLFRKNN